MIWMQWKRYVSIYHQDKECDNFYEQKMKKALK